MKSDVAESARLVQSPRVNTAESVQGVQGDSTRLLQDIYVFGDFSRTEYGSKTNLYYFPFNSGENPACTSCN